LYMSYVKIIDDLQNVSQSTKTSKEKRKEAQVLLKDLKSEFKKNKALEKKRGKKASKSPGLTDVAEVEEVLNSALNNASCFLEGKFYYRAGKSTSKETETGAGDCSGVREAKSKKRDLFDSPKYPALWLNKDLTMSNIDTANKKWETFSKTLSFRSNSRRLDPEPLFKLAVSQSMPLFELGEEETINELGSIAAQASIFGFKKSKLAEFEYPTANEWEGANKKAIPVNTYLLIPEKVLNLLMGDAVKARKDPQVLTWGRFLYSFAPFTLTVIKTVYTGGAQVPVPINKACGIKREYAFIGFLGCYNDHDNLQAAFKEYVESLKITNSQMITLQKISRVCIATGAMTGDQQVNYMEGKNVLPDVRQQVINGALNDPAAHEGADDVVPYVGLKPRKKPGSD